MVTIEKKKASLRRPGKLSARMIGRIVLGTCLFLLVLFVYLILGPAPPPPSASSPDASPADGVGSDNNSDKPKGFVGKTRDKVRDRVANKRNQISKALQSLSASHIPPRLREKRERNDIVGENLRYVRDGTQTVFEILHANSGAAEGNEYDNYKAPMEVEEIIEYVSTWLHLLHDTLGEVRQATYEDIWQAYHDLTLQTLYPWDREYLSRMPVRRKDGSIFVSLATYRDENCLRTLTQAFSQAKHPDKLFVGLVQQNCHENCKSGVLEGGDIEDVPPDDDCYEMFCSSNSGKQYCGNPETGKKSQVRLLDVNEPESLGPYAARYFASKLWYGEEWFLQIDAHMTFATHWDELVVTDMSNAPADKPVLSHYPPAHTIDLDAALGEPATRLCGPIFATMDLEAQIVRLEGSAKWDHVQLDTPRFAPFTAAGFFVAHSSFLREVPFDPFLPWIFMGEEIIMSSRLWTHGYDIFSPTRNLLGHVYVRRHKPKFWESVHRAFHNGIHNPLQIFILDRIKNQLGYPEASKDLIPNKSLLTAVEQYSMGTERDLDSYMRMVGLNMTTKEVTYTKWCETGQPPDGFEHLAHYYNPKTTKK